MEKEIKNRWKNKRQSIYNLRDNIEKLKRRIRQDLYSSDEKAKLTALIIRIMINTSERVGNEDSSKNGRFGITQFKNKHINIEGNQVNLNYIGKSGVKHEKCFSDEASAEILKELKTRKNQYIFTTKEGFKIKADKVNRYLKNFNAKSKDIRGFNANRMVFMELIKLDIVPDEKERPKIFNATLRKVAKKIGHGVPTLRTHYLLPEIEENFYKKGNLNGLKINF